MASENETVEPPGDEFKTLDEGNEPGGRRDGFLVASDSFEDFARLEEAKSSIKDRHPSGTINKIVREGSCEDPPDKQDEIESVSSGIASMATEEQNDSAFSDNGNVAEQVAPTLSASIHEEEELDEVHKPEWKGQKKHVFILSEAGKPIYSRYGAEDKLVTIMGVMQALVSFVQDSKDSMRCIISGKHKFVFLTRDHLLLVAVSCTSSSTPQLLLQLNYVYNQVLSVLTYSHINKIFKQRHNYDLRRLLTGAEKFFDSLLNLMDHEPGFLLSAVRCLPLPSAVRDVVAQSIVQHAKVKDLVFAILIANNQLITLVRMKKYFLHPADLHLIFNLVSASESFKTAESWTPICLPKFDSGGYLHAHVSYLDDNCAACLLLLTVDRDMFFTLSECKSKIVERLHRYNCIEAIREALTKYTYSISQVGIPDLRHFMYKSRSTAQFTSPELESPYHTASEQERIFGLYQYLHHRMHSTSRPLKILFHVGSYETLLGWVTSGFELYAVFGPLVTKPTAINSINKLLKWIKKEEDRLFILNSPTF
ncbi:unnamed protein product [Owenia fusiformis]|uniref:Vacuolar fusion protein MON1 homolog n=1 Tax=Owenia fusiformis TaxID=6347 RepID=A0A8J1T6L1_OWEFU|nr:unnamed protein product [Owenia fusiformis]